MDISKIKTGGKTLNIKDTTVRESVASQELAVNAALLDLDSRIYQMDDISTNQILNVNNSISSILSTITSLQNQHSNFVNNTEFQSALRAIMQAILDLDARINILNDTIS